MAKTSGSFVVVDIETTGGRAGEDAIIEIGMVKVTNGQQGESLCLLVQPGRSIPPWITSLTGISNYDVASAPTWPNVQRTVRQFLGEATFVAHNVGFDLSFIQQAFLRHGLGSYQPRKLCTARLARRMYPGAKSYGLASVCHALNIELNNHHRALDDAMASAGILLHALNHHPQALEDQLKTTNKGWIPGSLEESDFQSLPNSTGVYFLLNDQKKPLYIGKANNIKSRVYQHFSDKDYANKASRLQRETRGLHWLTTPNEFVALLLEDHFIKQHRPVLNRAQNHAIQRWDVFAYADQSGLYRLTAAPRKKRVQGIGPFGSYLGARQWILEWLGSNGFAFEDLQQMPIPQPQEPFFAAWQDLLQSQQQSDMGWLYLGVDDQGGQHAVEWRGSEPGEYRILSAYGEQQRFRIAVDFSFHRSLLALIERQGLQQEPPGGPLQIQGQMALW
jgi:DNA polymerase-3 subunit epsilon